MIRSQGKHETVPSLYLILSFLPVRDILILWWWSTCFGINATLTREEGRGKVIMVHCPNGVLRIPFVGRSQAPTRGGSIFLAVFTASRHKIDPFLRLDTNDSLLAGAFAKISYAFLAEDVSFYWRCSKISTLALDRILVYTCSSEKLRRRHLGTMAARLAPTRYST